MKLLDFFGKQIDTVIEDDHSLCLKRDYKSGDLSDTLAIFDECCKLGISAQIEFILETDTVHEVVMSNFKLQQNGVTSLIDAVTDARRADFTYKLATAKSVQQDSSKLTEALEEPFSEFPGALSINVYIPKSDLNEHFQKEYSPDSNLVFWLRFRNFVAFIQNQTEKFLQTVWGGKFPVFIVDDAQTEIKCKFCRVVPVDHGVKDRIDSGPYKIFLGLATEILSRGVGTHFLLNLTLCPLDSESHMILQNLVDEKLVEEDTPLRFGEGQYYDFKAKPADVARNVTAFANACGGMLIYGIDKDGKVQGCDPSRIPDSVSNAIREVQPSVKCDIVDTYVEGKYVLVLIVSPAEGSQVCTDGAGQRPFRYLSSVRLMRTDEEVLAARRTQCGL